MNIERGPREAEMPEEIKEAFDEENKEKIKNLSEIDKEDLSQVEQTREFQEIMELSERAMEIGEARNKAKGMGVLSRVGLNKKFELADKEYEKLINEVQEKKEKLGKEIDMEDPFLHFFIITALKKRIILEANKEQEESEKSDKGE